MTFSAVCNRFHRYARRAKFLPWSARPSLTCSESVILLHVCRIPTYRVYRFYGMMQPKIYMKAMNFAVYGHIRVSASVVVLIAVHVPTTLHSW